MAIEPEPITEVDEAIRDAWVAETVVRTRKRLEAFEAGQAPLSEHAREVYGEDTSPNSEAVTALAEPDDT